MGSKIRLKFKKWRIALFERFFGFEEGIDITNDVAVLHRRNVVIKNIIFLSNLAYTALLLFLSLTAGSQTDWVITILSFPLTYLINKLLKTLIKLDEKDYTKQMIATYVASFYIFISSLIIYARLQGQAYETASYVLIFYAIVVISLYQDKKILTTSFLSILLIMTVVHLIFTHSLPNLASDMDFITFVKALFSSRTGELARAFSDIVLRTLIFGLFYLVVYTIVSIGQYMQEERKNELIKRRQVQQDFSSIVKDLFSAVLADTTSLGTKNHAAHVCEIALVIADFIGYNKEQKHKLETYALIHLRYDEIKDLAVTEQTLNEQAYEALKVKTNLGSQIVKRVQLTKKVEAIIRGLLENTADDLFVHEMNLILPDQESQIILLSDLYVSLRLSSPYKRPIPHTQSLKYLQNELSVYFNEYLLSRVIRIQDEIEKIYNRS